MSRQIRSIDGGTQTVGGVAWMMGYRVVVARLTVDFRTMVRIGTDATLEAFYRRVRPGGPGWAIVSKRLGFGREPIPGGALAWTNWIAGIVAVYSTLFGIGKLVFGQLGALNLAQGALFGHDGRLPSENAGRQIVWGLC